MFIPILKVWDPEYPWDVRVEKIALSPAPGHTVHLTARNREGKSTAELVPEAHIHRLGWRHLLGTSGNALVMFPALFNPL